LEKEEESMAGRPTHAVEWNHACGAPPLTNMVPFFFNFPLELSSRVLCFSPTELLCSVLFLFLNEIKRSLRNSAWFCSIHEKDCALLEQ
jgi:hypothetical protein